ncbi:Globin-like family protein [Ancylostoma caninum]|uniref:Globin-like family protein n=1 Tax=Ancylostoma caninum TaxID=29170 RepID=A0A368GTJ0_ANCCA|nr:Globin-like family protein [Ancylostoma caninum]
MVAPADVKKHTVASLSVAGLGKTPDKGAENFTADDVQKSDRFEKLGTSILLSVHILANTYDNEPVFRAFCRDTIDRHAFWPIWMAFLESKGATLSADQKAAWDALGTTFNDECQQQLAKHGLPHL